MGKLFINIRRVLRGGFSPAVTNRKIGTLINTAQPEAYTRYLKDLQKMGTLVANSAHAQALHFNPAAVRPAVSSSNVANWMAAGAFTSTNTTAKDMFINAYRATAQQIKGAVLVAGAQNDTPAQLRQRVKPIEQQALRYVNTAAVSGANEVANQAKQKSFKTAGTEADRVMWNSTLDHRTSPFCQAADGKVFPIDEGPRPPAHGNCRSSIILIGKGESPSTVRRGMLPRPAVVSKSDAMLKDKGLTTKITKDSDGNILRGGRTRRPSKGSHSPLKGTTVRNTTYETWMRDQSPLYQDRVLGPQAAKSFRQGKPLGRVLRDTHTDINFEALDEALGAP